jgi:hypothetical protein
MNKQRFGPDEWNALSPEEKDRLQREAAALEDPSTPWNTYQPSIWEKKESPPESEDDH